MKAEVTHGVFVENKVEVCLRWWFLATWWPPSESDFTSTSLNTTRLRTSAYMLSRVAHVFVWMCTQVRRLCFVCLLSIRVTDVCPACLPVCLRLYLIIVRLIISACHWSIISIKTFTREECCASGVKVFSLTIWLALILWSASKNHGYWFRSLSNESSSNWTWLWLGCCGSSWFACSRRQFCLDFSMFSRNWLVCQTFLKASVQFFLLSLRLQADLFPGALVYFGSDVKTGFCLFGSFLSYADFELDTGVLLRNVI